MMAQNIIWSLILYYPSSCSSSSHWSTLTERFQGDAIVGVMEAILIYLSMRKILESNLIKDNMIYFFNYLSSRRGGGLVFNV